MPKAPPTPPSVLWPQPTGSNVFYCDSTDTRWDGVIEVYGLVLPPGKGTIFRINQDDSQTVIRGGADIDTSVPFVRSDTEAPFNVASQYILRLEPTSRAVFHNWFVNPSFENDNPTLSWLPGIGRTLKGMSRATPDPTYRSKYAQVSGYSGTPPIPSTIPQPSRINRFSRPSFEDGQTTGFEISNGTLSVVDVPAPPNGGGKALQADITNQVDIRQFGTGTYGDLQFGSAMPAPSGGEVKVDTSLRVPVGPGSYCQLSFYFRVEGAVTGVGTCRPDIYFSTVDGATSPVTSGVPITGTAAWQRLTVTALVPPGAVLANIQFTCDLVGAAQFDAIMVEQIPDPAVPPGEYFDGNTPIAGALGHEWTGTVNASPSIEGNLVYAATLNQRLLLSTKPDAALTWEPGTEYVVSGQVNVLPALYAWNEARSDPPTSAPIGGMTAPPARAWDDPLFTDSWGELLGYASGDQAPVGTLYIGLIDSTGALIPGTGLVSVGQIESPNPQVPVSFSAIITTPGALPAADTMHVAFFQGTGQRIVNNRSAQTFDMEPDPAEFQRIWNFDGLMLDKKTTFSGPVYFDGSMSVSKTPKGIGYTPASSDPDSFAWDSGDASISWLGAADNSASVFNGASVLGAYTGECMLESRETINGHNICEPVFISDPIIPQYNQWLGLLNIGPLSWAPRRELINILGRHAPVALSQARSTPSAEFRFMTNTLAERELFITIINTGRVLLLRNPDPSYPENDWYISIGEVSEERIITDHRSPLRRWVVSVQVVDRPSGLIAALSGQSWRDLRSGNGSWDAVNTTHENWLEALIGPLASTGWVSPDGMGMPTGPPVPGPDLSWLPVP